MLFRGGNIVVDVNNKIREENIDGGGNKKAGGGIGKYLVVNIFWKERSYLSGGGAYWIAANKIDDNPLESKRNK